MKFMVQPEVFSQLPGVCFGVVAAREIDNKKMYQAVADRLERAIEDIRSRLRDQNCKEVPEILIYRNALQKLGYNPNKFMCSIEALVKRILKGGNFPLINAIVDLGNAISLKYILPIGAHNINASDDDIEIRFSRQGDTFIPFGATEPEQVEAGEQRENPAVDLAAGDRRNDHRRYHQRFLPDRGDVGRQ